MSDKRKTFIIVLPLIFAIVFAAGIYIGASIIENSGENQSFFSSKSNKLNSLLTYIKEEYVEQVSEDSLIEISIPSILSKLDPHSVYISAKEFEQSNESLEGNFFGIGIEFNIQNDTVMVINPVAGGPSEKVGIQAGDRIIKVNDTTVCGKKLTTTTVMKKLKGEKGTKVKVSIQRKKQKSLIDFEIVRDRIPLHSVDVAYMIDNETGYLKLSKFSRNTFDEFMQSIDDLNRKNMKNLILDLRGNGGGYMEIATEMVDEFLDAGKVIVYTEGKSRPKKTVVSEKGGSCLNTNLVILIDEWSASASEIVAGAIQDNDRGTIVGRRSYGKGLVQEQNEFSDGSAIRLTVARYYTPTGRCIQKPYSNDKDEYNEDLMNRYKHGEFTDKDSIHFPDSLKFRTPAGKIVYGGGGIMPDVFVPLDSTGNSYYFRTVMNKGLVNQFGFQYADKNRDFFKKFRTYQELEKYLDTQNILQQFVKFAETKGVMENAKDLKVSKNILTTDLKAFIIRNIFDDKGFYPVFLRSDNALITALKTFNKE